MNNNRKPLEKMSNQELRQEIHRLLEVQNQLIIKMGEEAQARGVAEGQLKASEMAGILEGWIKKYAIMEKKLEAAQKMMHEMASMSERMKQTLDQLVDHRKEAAND